ncbi:MAG: hypothetical protein FJZ67_02650 [Bacteroidetes bacterium]|nr:hypothetical protein [Bacteroidota bacterium]
MIFNLKRYAQRKLESQENGNYEQTNDDLLKRKIYFKYTFLSGLIGALAVLLYYLPFHQFPSFFAIGSFQLSLLGFSFEITPMSISFNLFCLMIELFILGLINIEMVNEISKNLRFKNEKSDFIEMHKIELVNLSLENYKSKEREIGIDPFAELSKFTIVIFFVFNKIKAFLSNVIIKILVRKLAGRYVLRLYTDLVGMPIYFFWNAFACREVYRRTIFYYYSQNLINFTIDYINTKHESSEEIKQILYELLATVAVKKRELNSNHFVFSYKLLGQFQVPFQKKYDLQKNFIENLKKFPDELTNDLLLLFVTGMIIDGSINRTEKKELERMRKELDGNFPILDYYKDYLNAYKRGDAEMYLKKSILLV